jgi:hypothetical protein
MKGVIDETYRLHMKHRVEADPADRETLDTFKLELLDQMVQQDLNQGFVDGKRAVNGVVPTADDKRLDKAITSDNNKYFLAMQEASGKTIVDMSIMETAQEKSKAILSNKRAMVYLTSNSIKEDVRMEMELQSEFEGMGHTFGLKGIIDCVKIDYLNHKIYITDLKTTSKALEEWREGFEPSIYMYWMQCVVYNELILSLVPDTQENKDEPWKVEICFIVIDKFNHVYPFSVSPQSMQKYRAKTKECMMKAQWHLDENSYELPHDYERGVVVL